MSDFNAFQVAVLEGWPPLTDAFKAHRDAAWRDGHLEREPITDARLNGLLAALEGCTTPDVASDIVRVAGDEALAEIKGYQDKNTAPPDETCRVARALREINVAVWNVQMPPSMKSC